MCVCVGGGGRLLGILLPVLQDPVVGVAHDDLGEVLEAPEVDDEALVPDGQVGQGQPEGVVVLPLHVLVALHGVVQHVEGGVPLGEREHAGGGVDQGPVVAEGCRK